MSFSYLNSALCYFSWTTPHWLLRYFNTVCFKGQRLLENLFLFNHHLDLFTLVKIWMNLRRRGVVTDYKYKAHTETRTQQFRVQSSSRGSQHKGFLVQEHIILVVDNQGIPQIHTILQPSHKRVIENDSCLWTEQEAAEVRAFLEHALWVSRKVECD